MSINIRMFFLLTVGILFLFGCDPERENPLLLDDSSSENGQSALTVSDEIVSTEVSFEQNLLPILTARCAFADCHVAGGPEGIDLSTYQTFIRGGEDGPIFIPGNARESDIIEEIVSGRMPPGGPRLTDAQIQLFVDWINRQERTAGTRGDDDDDDHDDHDDDDDHDDHDRDHDDDND